MGARRQPHEGAGGSGWRWWACILAVATVGVCPTASYPEELGAFLDRLEATWNARDLPAYLELWKNAPADRVEGEREEIAPTFSGEALQLTAVRPRDTGGERLVVHGQAFVVNEPFARAQHYAFQLVRTDDGFALRGRELLDQVEGFVHLTDEMDAFRADGRHLHLDDLDIEMRTGTIFLTPQPVGPTALVFVGDGRARMTPRPKAERQQLREFLGATSLDEHIKRAFMRLNPADLERWLGPDALTPDPEADKRRDEARKVLDDWAGAAFRVSATLPRGPWWAVPPRGEAIALFPSRRGDLLLALTSHPEGVSLIDHSRLRQICRYPAADQPARVREEDFAEAHIEHHDLHVRYDPDDARIEARDTLRIRLLQPARSVSLRLDARLAIQSVEDESGSRLLWFRFGEQPQVVVPLGQLAEQAQEGITLTVRYGGSLPVTGLASDEALPLPRGYGEGTPSVYASRPLWYPQVETTDYATSSLELDVPRGQLALSGGALESREDVGDRTHFRYRQDTPVRYLAFAVGPYRLGALRDASGVSLEGYGTRETVHEMPDLLERASRILAFFQERFGPCPYPLLRLALTESAAPGGHSPPGLVLVSRRALFSRRPARRDPADFSDVPDFFLAHEIAHQWWGHGVAPEGYRQRWISEAMAQYAACLWTRHMRGDQAFRAVLKRMRRFALKYNDEGPILLGRRIGHLRNEPGAYRAVVYDKGACVLEMLRSVVGERAFFEALRALQRDRRFRSANEMDLAHALESASGRPVAAYVQAWMGTTDLPRIRWSRDTHATRSGFLTALHMEASGLPGPVPVEISLEIRGSTATEQVWLDAAGGTWEFATQKRPQRVRVDADGRILGHWSHR